MSSGPRMSTEKFRFSFPAFLQREFKKGRREVSCGAMVKEYNAIRKKVERFPIRAQTGYRYFRYLRALGLIRRAGKVPQPSTYPKQYWVAVREKLDDPAWLSCQHAYDFAIGYVVKDPETAKMRGIHTLGSRDYRRLIKPESSRK